MGRKRITLIAIVMIGIITMTGCGPKEEEKLKVRIAHDNNVNTPLHKAFLKYEELVEERSDGKIDIILFPGSQMGSVQDTFEQCRRGDIEMSGSTTSNFIQAIPELAVWESFYLFDDSAHAKRVFESEIGTVSYTHLDVYKRQEYALRTHTSRVAVRMTVGTSNAGNWNNGMPFTINLGCGTWGGNITSENVTWKNYINTTWVAREIANYKVPTDEELFGNVMTDPVFKGLL